LKLDPKTGQQVIDERLTDRARSEYERDLREFQNDQQQYRSRKSKYERDLQDYPAKLADWTQRDLTRRATLEANQTQVGQEILNKENALKELQESTKEGVAGNLKQTLSKLDSFETAVKISFAALEHLKSESKKPKPLCRPSTFDLIDFDWEVNRLQRNLRELR